MRFPAVVLAVAVLLFGVVFTAPAERAYGATSSSPGIGAAMGALVTATAVANGFSSADPRIAETVTAIGAAAASYAAGIAAATGAAVSAVPWISVAAAAGVGAILGAVPTSLGDDSLQSWQFNRDGTVTVSEGSSGSSGSGGVSGSNGVDTPLVVGQPYWFSGNDTHCAVACGGDAAAAAQAYVQQLGTVFAVGTCSQLSESSYSCSKLLNGSADGSFIVSEGSSYSGTACPQLSVKGACAVDVSVPTAPAGPVTESLASAVAGVDAADQGDPLNPLLLAAMTNALWQSAAAEGDGYAGLPYPVSAPVSSSQAASVESGLGSSAPTVGSAVSGAGTLAGVTATSPFTSAGSGAATAASGTAVATNPGSGAEVNLGPDPGIGAPGLETPPTAQQILAPILGLMADLKAWAVPAHTSECPEPSFELWGQTYSFAAQCDLLAQYGAQITVAFEVGFAVAAVLIVLTA